MVSNALLFTCICAVKSRHTTSFTFIAPTLLWHLRTYLCICTCVCVCECVVYFGQQQLNPNVAQCLPRRADPGAISHFNDSTELALLHLRHLLPFPLSLSLPPSAFTVCLPLLSCLLHTHAPKWLTTKQQQKKEWKNGENKQQLNGIVCRRNDSLIRCRGEVTCSAKSSWSFSLKDLIRCQSDRKTAEGHINCLS